MIQSIQYSRQNNDVTLSLKTLPFGIKRKKPNMVDDHHYIENIYVRWDKEGTAGSAKSWGQKNMFSLNLSLKESIGKWRIYVELISSEVRKDRMLFGAEFTLAPQCARVASNFSRLKLIVA